MRTVFLGTPAEAVPSLRALAAISDVAAVITNPDRPRGRSATPQPPPVKLAALELGLPVRQPLDHLELQVDLGAAGPEVGVVVAYGRIIRPAALAVPPRGFVNVHFSLLPRWRGASPVVRAILAGDVETGVTLMRLDEGMDTGPVVTRQATPIGPDESAGELTERLALLGAAALARTLPGYVAREIEPEPQSEQGATAAAKVRVEEAHLSPRHGPDAILRAVRAFDPKPGAWTTVDGRRLKVWRAGAASGGVDPGTIVAGGGVVLMGTRSGAVELLEVQPEGRARMAAADWMRGRRGEAAIWGEG